MGSVAQQEAPPIAQALDHALVHLEPRKPAEIAQSHIDAGPDIEQRAQFGSRHPLPPPTGLRWKSTRLRGTVYAEHKPRLAGDLFSRPHKVAHPQGERSTRSDLFPSRLNPPIRPLSATPN